MQKPRKRSKADRENQLQYCTGTLTLGQPKAWAKSRANAAGETCIPQGEVAAADGGHGGGPVALRHRALQPDRVRELLLRACGAPLGLTHSCSHRAKVPDLPVFPGLLCPLPAHGCDLALAKTYISTPDSIQLGQSNMYTSMLVDTSAQGQMQTLPQLRVLRPVVGMG